MIFHIKTLEEISTHELYAMLQLRSEVFVVEQNCVYQDIDGKDAKALHLMGYKNNQLLAYARIFKAGDYFEKASIGRVIVKEKERKNGYGNLLMNQAIKVATNHYHADEIKISAQLYLKNFYKRHGFIQISEPYLEDGILHIAMLWKHQTGGV